MDEIHFQRRRELRSPEELGGSVVGLCCIMAIVLIGLGAIAGILLALAWAGFFVFIKRIWDHTKPPSRPQ
jgi:hypothetical protein